MYSFVLVYLHVRECNQNKLNCVNSRSGKFMGMVCVCVYVRMCVSLCMLCMFEEIGGEMREMERGSKWSQRTKTERLREWKKFRCKVQQWKL